MLKSPNCAPLHRDLAGKNDKYEQMVKMAERALVEVGVRLFIFKRGIVDRK